MQRPKPQPSGQQALRKGHREKSLWRTKLAAGVRKMEDWTSTALVSPLPPKLQSWGQGFEPTTRNAYPDSGCEQSLISQDLIKVMGLELEPMVKNVKAVNGSKVKCAGSAAVRVDHQGQIMKTRLLATLAIKNEVILLSRTSRSSQWTSRRQKSMHGLPRLA